MKSVIHDVLHGKPLRHRSIALPVSDQRQVRIILESAGRDCDVTQRLFGAALKPFTIGLHLTTTEADALTVPARATLRFEDATDAAVIGRLLVRTAPGFDLGPALGLLRPVRSTMPAELIRYRAWRHFLAWRHTRAGARIPHTLEMSYPDLRALNVFYVLPRPVFLASVASGERSYLFPMDLVAQVAADRCLLALRRTSLSVETICADRRVVVSGVPARRKEIAYRLGAHHKQLSIDWTMLPFGVVPSDEFGIPRPVDSTIVRELQIEQFHEIGSHMLFISRIVSQRVSGDVPQLCHVSDMYARWRERHGRPFVDA